MIFTLKEDWDSFQFDIKTKNDFLKEELNNNEIREEHESDSQVLKKIINIFLLI